MSARDVPPPYDGDAYGPTGTLSAEERAFADRLYHPLHAILGWRLVGRDCAGQLVATTVLSSGTRDPAHVRHCYLTLTPEGLVSRTRILPIAAPAPGV